MGEHVSAFVSHQRKTVRDVEKEREELEKMSETQHASPRTSALHHVGTVVVMAGMALLVARSFLLEERLEALTGLVKRRGGGFNQQRVLHDDRHHQPPQPRLFDDTATPKTVEDEYDTESSLEEEEEEEVRLEEQPHPVSSPRIRAAVDKESSFITTRQRKTGSDSRRAERRE